MSQTVARRARTRKRRQYPRQQRRQAQRQVQRAIDERVTELVRAVLEQALRDEVTVLLGRGKSERRDLTDATEGRATCNRCGTRLRRQFCRAGTYERGLLTSLVWGVVQVPRVSCVCGGMVDVELATLVPYGRLWFDLEERARHLAGLCVSLRDSVEVLAWQNGQPVSIATVNRLVNETAGLAEAFQAGPLTRVPPVVMLDGLWLKVLEPTGEVFRDKLGRRRQRHKLRKFPLLVAYGVDPVTGERWLLDWEQGRAEDQGSWQGLLERLWARGLSATAGLRLIVHDGGSGLTAALAMVDFGRGVVHQRCVFHKLQNVRRDSTGTATMSRSERQQHRAAVLRDAAAVYDGADAPAIHQRLAAFRTKWEATEPAAVATLERDFDQTLAYLTVREQAQQAGQVWRLDCLRTTSPLERVQRHFRQKFRQMVLCHSEAGLAAAVHLVIGHRHLDGPTAQLWTQRLEEALLVS